jgi:riboflavin biosynthesis pyrimidine reductase
LFLETSHKNLHFPARDILQVLQSNQVSHFLEKPLQSLFVEGGGRLLSSFVYDQIFDLIHVFVAPFFLGGTQHKLFSKKKRHFFRYPVQEVGKTIRYHIAVQEKLDEDILIELLKK